MAARFKTERYHRPPFLENCMKNLVLSFVLLAAASAFAADSPPMDPPAASDHVGDARRAIQVKNWSTAITELKTAVREEPRNADAHNLLAYSYRKQAKSDLPKAFEHYGIALKLNPNHRGAHEYIGEAYLMDKKPAAAEKHLAELERICGNKTCEEYADLQRAISAYKVANK
jgi:Flp pilus assembly protein TadD